MNPDDQVVPIKSPDCESGGSEDKSNLTPDTAEARKTGAVKKNRINPDYAATVIRNLPKEYLPCHSVNIMLPKEVAAENQDGGEKLAKGAKSGRKSTKCVKPPPKWN